MSKETRIVKADRQNRPIGTMRFADAYDDHWARVVQNAEARDWKAYHPDLADDYYVTLRINMNFLEASKGVERDFAELSLMSADQQVGVAVRAMIYEHMLENGTSGLGLGSYTREDDEKNENVTAFKKKLSFLVQEAEKMHPKQVGDFKHYIQDSFSTCRR